MSFDSLTWFSGCRTNRSSSPSSRSRTPPVARPHSTSPISHLNSHLLPLTYPRRRARAIGSRSTSRRSRISTSRSSSSSTSPSSRPNPRSSAPTTPPARTSSAPARASSARTASPPLSGTSCSKHPALRCVYLLEPGREHGCARECCAPTSYLASDGERFAAHRRAGSTRLWLKSRFKVLTDLRTLRMHRICFNAIGSLCIYLLDTPH